MNTPANYRQVAKLYDSLSPTLQKYLKHFPKLINNNDLPLEITIAYLFQKLESAHRRALYGIIVKKYFADAKSTHEKISKSKLRRKELDKLFERITLSIPHNTKKLLQDAESIRDDSMHGRKVKVQQLREAISNVLNYLETFNSHVCSAFNIKPCGGMRGFTGKAKKLDEKTTHLIFEELKIKDK